MCFEHLHFRFKSRLSDGFAVIECCAQKDVRVVMRINGDVPVMVLCWFKL